MGSSEGDLQQNTTSPSSAFQEGNLLPAMGTLLSVASTSADTHVSTKLSLLVLHFFAPVAYVSDIRT